jgi:hypothetical protein
VNLWIVTMWLDLSCEDCGCSNLSEALEFAEALKSDYRGRISYLSITNPDETVEIVVGFEVGEMRTLHHFAQTA